MRYAMSDIHGRLTEFIKMLEVINFRDKDTLYICGDCIDYGPNSLELIQYIMNKSNIKVTMGNHEQMFLNIVYLGEENFGHWLVHFGEEFYYKFNKLPSSEKNKIVRYIQNMPLYYKDDYFIMCHAGIDSKYSLSHQNPDYVLWITKEFYNHIAVEGYITIFGHTPTNIIRKNFNEEELNPMSIWYDTKYQDKIGLDCGMKSFGAGRLACYCLDTSEEFYVEEEQ